MPFVVSVAYLAESEKYDSSAVTRLRRSDFIAAMYAFDLVFANFGIAIAARMPMMTTTIRSSIRVKPRRARFIIVEDSPGEDSIGTGSCCSVRRVCQASLSSRYWLRQPAD